MLGLSEFYVLQCFSRLEVHAEIVIKRKDVAKGYPVKSSLEQARYRLYTGHALLVSSYIRAPRFNSNDTYAIYTRARVLSVLGMLFSTLPAPYVHADYYLQGYWAYFSRIPVGSSPPVQQHSPCLGGVSTDTQRVVLFNFNSISLVCSALLHASCSLCACLWCWCDRYGIYTRSCSSALCAGHALLVSSHG